MTLDQALKRIKALEKRVAELEARPPQEVHHHHYPAYPAYPAHPPAQPTVPMWPTLPWIATCEASLVDPNLLPRN